MDNKDKILEIAKSVLQIEADAIKTLQGRLGDDCVRAVNMLFSCKGKIVVSGMGKSGHIARKISSTLSSTGTSSVFLHPAESSHGDLGILASSDLLIAISYSGLSHELDQTLKFCKRNGISIISMTSNPASLLAQNADVNLDISVKKEACPLGLAPTSSSTATLALGDALAMALLDMRGFKSEDFALRHPGGSLGRRLILQVEDLMHGAENLPLVRPDTSIKSCLFEMGAKPIRGIVGVVDSDNRLLGTVTDGDIRRFFEAGSVEPLSEMAKNVMAPKPFTIQRSALAQKALAVMEKNQVQSLFVLEESEKGLIVVGLVHLQDLLAAKIV